MDGFELVHDLFVLVQPPSASKKDLLYCNIPKGLPQLVSTTAKTMPTLRARGDPAVAMVTRQAVSGRGCMACCPLVPLALCKESNRLRM